jgi:hypothetical protein
MNLKPKKWSHFGIGLLCLVLGVLAISSGYVGRLWFPEMSTSGPAARLVGVLWLVVAGIALRGAYTERI